MGPKGAEPVARIRAPEEVTEVAEIVQQEAEIAELPQRSRIACQTNDGDLWEPQGKGGGDAVDPLFVYSEKAKTNKRKHKGGGCEEPVGKQQTTEDEWTRVWLSLCIYTDDVYGVNFIACQTNDGDLWEPQGKGGGDAVDPLFVYSEKAKTNKRKRKGGGCEEPVGKQ
ncbi:hypothetical protein F2Q70_00038212 [Brassica cretica]|uniref:Uncharacterized protein n=1 Tax=Brassica cretica TaxID=69181 RepID=A0A8S9KAB4_BRACR|nr:hypothetical protein F2Q70_00038212 [Brassica cretica]